MRLRQSKNELIEAEHVYRYLNGSTSTEHVPAAEPEPAPARRPSLATLLTAAGVATYAQITEALEEGLRTGEKLGEIAVRLDWTTEEGLARLLAEQWQLPFVEAGRLRADASAAAKLPAGAARPLGAVPVVLDSGGLCFAVADPSPGRMTAIAETVGNDPNVAIVDRSTFEQLLGELESFSADGHSEPAAPPLAVAGRANTTPADDLAVAVEAIVVASSRLGAVRIELDELAAALQTAYEQLADAQMTNERDAGTIRRLEAELAARDGFLETLKTRVADLGRTLDGLSE